MSKIEFTPQGFTEARRILLNKNIKYPSSLSGYEIVIMANRSLQAHKESKRLLKLLRQGLTLMVR